MLFVPNFGTVEERLDKITQSINRSPIVLPFCLTAADATITTTASYWGGCAIPREYLTQFTPDAEWILRAHGFANGGDANGCNYELIYQADNTAVTVLDTTLVTGASVVKQTIGPVDLFAAAIPQNEAIPVVRLRATKVTSGSAFMAGGWTLYLELRPSVYG